jgi:hypothetical protein
MTTPTTPTTPAPQRQPVCLTVGRLEVRFDWRDDRWGHRFFIDGEPVWESVEGAAGGPPLSDRWPASPAFTEIMVTETAAGPALVAVGRAGRSHFSASLTAAANTADTLLAEIACRLQEVPDWLGSTYRPLRHEAEKRPAGGQLSIQPPPGAGSNLPATSNWSYRVGVSGFTAVSPASCEQPADQSD